MDTGRVQTKLAKQPIVITKLRQRDRRTAGFKYLSSPMTLSLRWPSGLGARLVIERSEDRFLGLNKVLALVKIRFRNVYLSTFRFILLVVTVSKVFCKCMETSLVHSRSLGSHLSGCCGSEIPTSGTMRGLGMARSDTLLTQRRRHTRWIRTINCHHFVEHG